MEPDPKETYDALCQQINRETLLCRSRINTGLLVNGGLGAGAASQLDGLACSLTSLIIFTFACLAGLLVNFEFKAELDNSWKQTKYLQGQFDKLDRANEGRFPRPFLDPKYFSSPIPSRYRQYPNIFLFLWGLALLWEIALLSRVLE